MPRARLTKSAIDALPTPSSELVYWDETLPGFGVKVTPAGRKVFVVLYRTAGAGSRLRKYTIGPYGRVTLHVARNEAQRVLVARTEGRDPATEKREARRRLDRSRRRSRGCLHQATCLEAALRGRDHPHPETRDRGPLGCSVGSRCDPTRRHRPRQ